MNKVEQFILEAELLLNTLNDGFTHPLRLTSEIQELERKRRTLFQDSESGFWITVIEEPWLGFSMDHPVEQGLPQAWPVLVATRHPLVKSDETAIGRDLPLSDGTLRRRTIRQRFSVPVFRREVYHQGR